MVIFFSWNSRNFWALQPFVFGKCKHPSRFLLFECLEGGPSQWTDVAQRAGGMGRLMSGLSGRLRKGFEDWWRGLSGKLRKYSNKTMKDMRKQYGFLISDGCSCCCCWCNIWGSQGCWLCNYPRKRHHLLNGPFPRKSLWSCTESWYIRKVHAFSRD